MSGTRPAGRIVVGARGCAGRTRREKLARQARGLARRPVRRVPPSEPRAGTVTPLSGRTFTGGDAGTGRNVRRSSGMGNRLYALTARLTQLGTTVILRRALISPSVSGSIFIRDLLLDEWWGVLL